MIVGDIMTTDLVCIKEHDVMTYARKLLRDNHLHSLPVLDDKGRVVGMLDDQDVLRLHSNKSEVTVSGYAREFPLITPDMEVRDAVKALIGAQQHRAPVMKSSTDKTLVGILSDTNLLRHVRLTKLPPKTVGEIMNTKVKTAYPDDSIAKIWGNMLEWDYTGIPVVSHDDEVMGIITRSDIIKVGFSRVVTRSGDFHDSGSGKTPKVEKLMSTPLYSINSDTTISKAIESIIQYDVGRICVTDNKKLIGIVDRFSLLKECLAAPGFE
ncbi:CBS domain-containing protein [Methanolobus sp.]|uniref:CBS domain-containing protein n=1 Tax=Methanolobus sp. TaxID=1874737 RepID=UPI0025D769DF|nr:CBS domain-containing protein [Methanolobus sp.]